MKYELTIKFLGLENKQADIKLYAGDAVTLHENLKSLIDFKDKSKTWIEKLLN